jgi:hypothetical protein
MPIRFPSPALAAFALLSVACVTAPPSEQKLAAGAPLEGISQGGLVEARLEIAESSLRTGNNDFVLTMESPSFELPPALDGVVAFMPAHGHSAHPRSIEGQAGVYRIDALPLDMAGFWQIDCRLTVGHESDALVFDLDVP